MKPDNLLDHWAHARRDANVPTDFAAGVMRTLDRPPAARRRPARFTVADLAKAAVAVAAAAFWGCRLAWALALICTAN